MHFNIYVDDALGQEFTAYAKAKGVTRNRLIREALAQFMHKRQAQWPDAVLSFKGVPTFPAFEASRTELLAPKEDPFA